MNVEGEVQKALRARLIGASGVTSLVPASNVLDTHQRPAPRPSIVLGESQSVDTGTSVKRTHTRITHTMHVWVSEPSLEGAKGIGAAIKTELRRERLTLPAGLSCADLHVTSQRFMRDPDGEHSHGVINVEILVSEELS
jgi:Xaa-Pro aminopeptidase